MMTGTLFCTRVPAEHNVVSFPRGPDRCRRVLASPFSPLNLIPSPPPPQDLDLYRAFIPMVFASGDSFSIPASMFHLPSSRFQNRGESVQHANSTRLYNTAANQGSVGTPPRLADAPLYLARLHNIPTPSPLNSASVLSPSSQKISKAQHSMNRLIEKCTPLIRTTDLSLLSSKIRSSLARRHLKSKPSLSSTSSCLQNTRALLCLQLDESRHRVRNRTR